MPLVVPGVTSSLTGSSDSKTSEWQNKLLGKKIGDASDNMVTIPSSPLPAPPTSNILLGSRSLSSYHLLISASFSYIIPMFPLPDSKQDNHTY